MPCLHCFSCFLWKQHDGVTLPLGREGRAGKFSCHISRCPRVPCRTNTHAAIDWGKMAEQWLQEKEAERRKQKQRLTPRPSPSPMIESTPMSIAGDATPLLDEMDR